MVRDVALAVIPVAGFGTRLLPATKSQPKEMLPVGRKPVVQYVVEELAENGIKQILFVTGKGKTSIENHFDFDHELTRLLRETGKEELLSQLEYEQLRLHFFFTRQRMQKGLGDAVLCGRHFTGDRPFAVALGDSILGLGRPSRAMERMAQIFKEERASCVIAVEEVPLESVSNYGIVYPAAAGEVFPVKDVIEKPSPEQTQSRLAIAARYIFSPSIYEALEQTRPMRDGEIQLTDAIRLGLERGEKVLGIHIQEKRYDIGNFRSYFEAFVDFAMSDPEYGPDLTAALMERLGESH